MRLSRSDFSRRRMRAVVAGRAEVLALELDDGIAAEALRAAFSDGGGLGHFREPFPIVGIFAQHLGQKSLLAR